MRGQHIFVPEHFRHGPHASHPVRDFNVPRAKAIEALLDNFRMYERYTVETEPRFFDGQRTYLADLLVRECAPAKTIDTVVQVESGPFLSNAAWDAATYFSSEGMNYLLVLVAHDAGINPQGKYFRQERRNETAQTVRIVEGNEKLIYEAFKRNVYFTPSTSTFAVVQFRDYAERVRYDICTPNGRVIISAGTLRELKTRKIPHFELQQQNFILDYALVKHHGQTIRAARPLAINASLSFDKLLEIERRAAANHDADLWERAAIAILGKMEQGE